MFNNIKKISLLIIVTIILSSCNASKTVTSSAVADTSIKTKQIVNAVDNAETKFKTIVGKLKIETINGDKSQSANVSFRMEKDKTIWISKLGIVKALVTPDRVAFYNKLDGTYFDGDFSYLSNLVGTELDFYKLQNILLGQPILPLDAKTFDSSVADNSYTLNPKQQLELYEIFFLINPSHFKTNSQQITQIKEKRLLQIDYLSYQNVEKLKIPENIKILAVEDGSELQINLELKSLDLDKDLSFPFEIPSGYELIKL
jgi:hypothetical protein